MAYVQCSQGQVEICWTLNAVTMDETERVVCRISFLENILGKRSLTAVMYSKRVGHVVPGVVVYLSFHAWVGWVSE